MLGCVVATRCLLVCGNELLKSSVESLISVQPNLEVICASASTKDELLPVLQVYRPDVLISDDLMDFGDAADLHQSLKAFPDLLMIMINSCDNHLQIFEKKDVLISRASDLIALIQDR